MPNSAWHSIPARPPKPTHGWRTSANLFDHSPHRYLQTAPRAHKRSTSLHYEAGVAHMTKVGIGFRQGENIEASPLAAYKRSSTSSRLLWAHPGGRPQVGRANYTPGKVSLGGRGRHL